tara:strand:+ start:1945 stop:2217 length:273 start_codon:yes stop_codon:yes gene_type:complete
MTLLENQVLLNFLQIYGLFSFFTTFILVVFIIKNYLTHKNFFFSLKDVQIKYLNKEIQSLKEKNEIIQNKYQKLEQENDELSKIIIKKIK